LERGEKSCEEGWADPIGAYLSRRVGEGGEGDSSPRKRRENLMERSLFGGERGEDFNREWLNGFKEDIPFPLVRGGGRKKRGGERPYAWRAEERLKKCNSGEKGKKNPSISTLPHGRKKRGGRGVCFAMTEKKGGKGGVERREEERKSS